MSGVFSKDYSNRKNNLSTALFKYSELKVGVFHLVFKVLDSKYLKNKKNIRYMNIRC